MTMKEYVRKNCGEVTEFSEQVHLSMLDYLSSYELTLEDIGYLKEFDLCPSDLSDPDHPFNENQCPLCGWDASQEDACSEHCVSSTFPTCGNPSTGSEYWTSTWKCPVCLTVFTINESN